MNEKWSTCTGDEDPFWNFCDENSIKKSTYRGKALEGPQTLLLLEKLDLLERSIPRRVRGSDYIAALKSFKILYNSCFHMTLDDNWLAHLRDFKQKIEKLNWTTGSTKLHILMDHLGDFVSTKGPLGPFNEEASEVGFPHLFNFKHKKEVIYNTIKYFLVLPQAVHHDWKPTWDRYKKYPNEENLLEAVCAYNYRRI